MDDGSGRMTTGGDAPKIGRQASVLICDDIRREDNGKEIYLGVYSGGIIVPFVPFILPKLCFVFHYQCDVDLRPKSLAFVVQLPGMKSEFVMPMPEERLISPPLTPTGQSARYLRFAAAAMSMSVPLRATGRVLMWTVDETERRCFYASRVETRSAELIPAAERETMIAQMQADIDTLDRANAAAGLPSVF
jgi:hypothetical protein